MTLNKIIADLKIEMPNPMIQDGETLRAMTDNEKNEWYELSAKTQLEDQIEKTEAEAKVTARQAILDRLGLTAEEAALLLS
jgi:hypothetical protein